MTAPLQPSITLQPAATRVMIAGALNDRLADVCQLHRMVQVAHWNVRGEHAFLPAHKLFDHLACALEKTTHGIAGRIRTLGVQVTGTLQPPPNPRLIAYPPDITSVEDHLREVSSRLAVLIGLLRVTRDMVGGHDEQQTEDMLTRKICKLEKKGRRLMNSQPDSVGTVAMTAAVAALGNVEAGARAAAPTTPSTPAGPRR